MKSLLLIVALAFAANAQAPDWKLIKEMTGDIPNHPGLTIETYAAQITRGGDIVKLMFRVDLPGGAPVDIFKDNAPRGIDVSSIVRVEGGLKLNCKTLVVKPSGGSASVYQFNGKKHKSSEPPFKIESGNILALYFCEQPSIPSTGPPVLKRKP